jgi:hypothetical protein
MEWLEYLLDTARFDDEVSFYALCLESVLKKLKGIPHDAEAL